jgi:rhodanese-related sulfurtransferase
MKPNEFSKIFSLVQIFFISLCIISPTVKGDQINTYKDISVDIAHQMIKNGSYPNLVILDVRDKIEFDMGHIRKALLIPYHELEARINELESYKKHEILVYCRSGSRSTIASRILESNGFTKVYNMIGGIETWIGKEYPVTKSYLLEIYLNLRPNPSKTGQRITLKGVLFDQFYNPVIEKNVKLYYRNVFKNWRFAEEFTTNAIGAFTSFGLSRKKGIYQIIIVFEGDVNYEPSYTSLFLVIQDNASRALL